jgi:hypothetical protein
MPFDLSGIFRWYVIFSFAAATWGGAFGGVIAMFPPGLGRRPALFDTPAKRIFLAYDVALVFTLWFFGGLGSSEPFPSAIEVRWRP